MNTATETLLKHTGELEKAQLELVNKVEDATRRVLQGFPEIFERAYWLVQRADRELWLVNFTLEFGRVHCESKSVRTAYEEEFGRNFESDVRMFNDALEIKVKQVPIVNVLTISDDAAYDKFMKPLIDRPDYSSLGFLVTDSSILEGKLPQPRYQLILESMKRMKSKFVNELATNRRGRFRGAHQYRCYELPSLPIQLLIAGIKQGEGESHKKFGCLLFMVGSDTLPTVEPGTEIGIYTELDNMVDVMKGLAWTLMKPTDPLCWETDPDRFMPLFATESSRETAAATR